MTVRGDLRLGALFAPGVRTFALHCYGLSCVFVFANPIARVEKEWRLLLCRA